MLGGPRRGAGVRSISRAYGLLAWHVANISLPSPHFSLRNSEEWNSPHSPAEETLTQTPRSFKALSHVTELGGTRAHVCVILKSTSCPCSQSLLGVIPATGAGGPKRRCEEDPGATTCPAGVPGRAGGGAGQAAKKPQGHARADLSGAERAASTPPCDTLGPVLRVTSSHGSNSNSKTPHSELRTMGGGRNFQKALALSPLLLFLTCPNLDKPRLEKTSSQAAAA